MAKSHGSVRIGPISLFTLIIILCLAVMAVLSVTTARADLAITQRQANTTSDTYANEIAAQTFLADLDAMLAKERAASATAAATATEAAAEAATSATDTSSLLRTVELALPKLSANASMAAEESVNISARSASDTNAGSADGTNGMSVTAQLDGNIVNASFTMESGRSLSIAIAIRENATYEIQSWKATTLWDSSAGENLWSGA